tara:strand:- start:926 stop:2083 length:1158 start_codon:yes stop_codon:yes gene_type:complete
MKKKENRKKIMLVCGTRPEAIKLAPLFLSLQNYSDSIQTFFCVTGQHKEMLFQVLSIFNIKPDYDLKVMRENQSFFELTSNILIKMKKILKKVKPDLVIVHGDTISTFAVSLASFYLKIKVAHVEAGLRTHNIYSPYPEELNRQLVSKIADFHFAPTALSKKNLISENIDSKKILVTGNTVIDSLQNTVNLISSNKILQNSIEQNFNKILNFNLASGIYILITVHRRENFGSGLKEICSAINELSKIYREIKFILPVHMNPNIKNEVKRALGNKKNIYLIKPQNYINFVYLLKQCHIVLTDSGGIQEEAPSLGKPVLVMRDKTERPEGVIAGTLKVIGSSRDSIVKETSLLINNKKIYKKMSISKNPYGNGKSSKKIAEFINNLS